MKTKREIRNSLGDDISWKTLYAMQNGIYESPEEALVDAIRWRQGINIAKVIKLLQRELV